MNAKRLIYVNGHFYEPETQKRITLSDDIEVTLTTEPKYFLPSIEAGSHKPVRTSKEQETTIKADKKVKECKLVFHRGKKLFFIIPHYSSLLRDSAQHEFEIELLEDLYVYTKLNAKKGDSRLFDCACIVKQNTNKTIKMFEVVLGGSLNEVYKNTFVHYFGNEGNPSCNAINRFYEESGKEKETCINRYRRIEPGENIKNSP